MSLIAIAELPRNPTEWQTWAFSHMALHTDIARVVYQLAAIRLDLYPLDPISFDANWTYRHALMHEQMDQVLGIAGYNLTGIAWNDPDAMRAFIEFNYTEHERANQILRL